MRLLLLSLVSGALVLVVACPGMAQPSSVILPAINSGPDAAPGANIPPTPAQGTALYLGEIDGLRTQQAALQASTPDEEQKKRIELLEKQIAILESQMKLLADQIKKAPPTGAAVEQL